MDDIHGDKSTKINGIHVWAEEGIVGRGILLDFHSWRVANNVGYEPFKTGSISLGQLETVAKAQGTEIKFGDILIVRSGYTAAFEKLLKDQAKAYVSVVPPTLSGVEQSEAILEARRRVLLL